MELNVHTEQTATQPPEIPSYTYTDYVTQHTTSFLWSGISLEWKSSFSHRSASSAWT